MGGKFKGGPQNKNWGYAIEKVGTLTRGGNKRGQHRGEGLVEKLASGGFVAIPCPYTDVGNSHFEVDNRSFHGAFADFHYQMPNRHVGNRMRHEKKPTMGEKQM